MTVLDPAPLRHQKVMNRGMDTFKRYANSTLDEWQSIGEKDGVRLYSRKPEIPHAPMIYRGEYHYAADPMMIEHTTPLDLTSSLIFPSVKCLMDSRMGHQETRLVCHQYSFINYSQTYPVWPLQPRDFLQINQRESKDDETAYFCSISVIDDELSPPQSGFVRAHVESSGLKVARDTTDGGWILTSICQMDPGGSVPTILTTRTLQTLPTAAQRIANYLDRFGFPPSATLEKVEYLGEAFDHDTTVYTLHLGGQGRAQITCCARMFPEGFDVEIQGQGQYHVDEVTKKPHKVVQLTQLQGSVTVLVKGNVQLGSLCLKKKK